MQLSSECIQCVLGSALELMNKQLAFDRHENVTRQMLDLAAGQSWQESPPEFAEKLYMALRKAGGVDDSFYEAKMRSTELALELLPEMRQIVAQASDPFAAAVKAVIGGNIIDCGADRSIDVNKAIPKLKEVFHMPLAEDSIREFEKLFYSAKKIFYMLDNCGEAVFDKLLLERFQGEITLGVRGDYILNDITTNEIEASGLSGYPVIDTGTATPGVSLKRAKKDFLDAIYSADLVIAKGQGNFETLGDFNRKIVHLLRVKCPVVARNLNMPKGELALVIRN